MVVEQLLKKFAKVLWVSIGLEKKGRCIFVLLFKCFFLAIFFLQVGCTKIQQVLPNVQDSGNAELMEFEVVLPNESLIKIYYQAKDQYDLTLNIAQVLKEQHFRYHKIFAPLPKMKTEVVLIDRDLFFVKTGAPIWIHAIYHNQKIFIPIGKKIDYFKLYRALRHEYTHAVIHELTGGRAVAWIDEGLAQYFERADKTSEMASFARWLYTKDPLPLSEIELGFTKLPENRAKIAYMQSLFATKDLLNTYGVPAFKRYFGYLKNGFSQSHSFELSFKISTTAYEKRLRSKLRRWAISYNRGL